MQRATFVIVMTLFALFLTAQDKSKANFGPLNNKVIHTSVDKINIDHLAILQSAKTSNNRDEFIITLKVKGVDKKYVVMPNEVIDDEFRRNFPYILTFDLYNIDKSIFKGALTLSTIGLFATILNEGEMISIYPENFENTSFHIVEYGIQAEHFKMSQYCGHDHSIEHDIRKNQTNFGKRAVLPIGEKRYDYRLAVVTTGEFYVANGNNDNAVRTVVVNSANAISAIFNSELSFRLSIGSRIYLDYRDPATDIFIPDETGGTNRPDQAGTAVSMHFNSTTYDVGHVFHKHSSNDGWSTGGVAQLQSVCRNSLTGQGIISKARGWSGSFNNAGNGWINLAAHEFGHQFGANHTFNGIGESCTTAIRDGNSFEIGSGTTIMSYNGICDPGQNIPESGVLDNYFHTKSMEEMSNYVYTSTGGTCGGPVNSNNALPTVQAESCNASYRVPKGTPFYLNAKGTWTDNDSHTYCWEQIDEDGQGTPTHGFIGIAAGNSPIAPLFRSYPPTTSSERYFPSLDILNTGMPNDFEVLPNVPRVLHFNVTLRDNNIQGGAAASSDLALTVANSGPFVLTRPNGNEIFQAGQTESITWNTNGSNSLCNNVRIKLSTDGGLTYPTILAENVLYSSGVFNFSIPSQFVKTTKAKVMIECMDYDCFKFFILSRSNFSINSMCTPDNSVVCPTSKITLDEGDPNLNINMNKVVGSANYPITKLIDESLPTMGVAVKGVGGVGCSVVSNYYHQKVRIYITDAGNYTFNIAGSGFVSLFRSNFIESSPCASFVTSSATEIANGSITRSPVMTTALSGCTEYVLVFYTFSTLPVSFSVSSITGPNIVIEKNIAFPATFLNVYLVVNNSDDKVVYASNTLDLRSLPGGDYTIYSIVVDSGVNLNTYIGTIYAQMKNAVCFNRSLNSRQVEIKTACKIINISPGSQGSCEPGSNFYTQQLIITYNKPPSNGKLNVNGQVFDITASPQSITLINLDANGLPVDVNAYFTSSPNCKLINNAQFTAPQNCCPIQLELGPDKTKCVGDSIDLDAGNFGISYKWFKNGIEISGQTMRILSVLTDGEYEVEVTHSTGCKKKDKVTVNFNQKPNIIFPPAASFCIGETFTISPNITNGTIIKWYKNNVEIIGQIFTNLDITEAGTYKLEVMNAAGCASSVEKTYTTMAAPIVNLGQDLDKCEGEMITLNAGDDGTIYTWFKDGVLIPGALLKTFNPVQSGTYRVQVKNAALCSTTDEVVIKFFASPIVADLPLLVESCQGTAALLNATASDFTGLQWFFNNNPINSATSLTLTANNTGAYAIEAVNAIGCKTKKSTQVEIRPLPILELGSDKVACIGSNVELDAGGSGTVYKWTRDATTLPNVTSKISIATSGSYRVTVTNQFGCTATDVVNVSFVQGPSLDIGGNKAICQGTTYTINAITDTPSATIRWIKDGTVLSGQFDFALTVSQTGTYEAIVLGGNPSCEVRKSVQITVNPKPGLNLGADRLLCKGDLLPMLDGGIGQTSYSWTLDGVAISTSRTVTADKSGTYSVLVKNSFGCEAIDDIKVTINEIPTLVLNTEYNLCKGTQIEITAESDGNSFVWKKSGAVIPNESSKTIKLNVSGIYALTATNAANCKNELSFNVIERAIPNIDLGMDTSLCPGETKTLVAGPNLTYKWSDNSILSNLVINAGSPAVAVTNKYAVTVTNSFGCTAKDSINISLNPVVKATLSSDKPGVCNGEPVNLTAGGGTIFKWTDPSNTLSNINQKTTIASPLVTTSYTVEVSDACPNNKDSKTIEIKVFEPVDVSAGRDTCVILGRTIKLNAKGGVSYSWDNTDLITGSPNIANPVVKPIVETIFTVTITDKNGCKFSDNVKVCIILDPLSLFKPVSIITPNGDGLNDDLYFAGLDAFPDNTLKIFNRWGNLLFEAKGYQSFGILFNGMRNGERLPADTYYYVLVFEDQVIKSSLTIIWD